MVTQAGQQRSRMLACKFLKLDTTLVSNLGPQNSLHGFRVIKDNKSKVGQFPTNTLGVDPQLQNISICCEEQNKVG